MLSYVCAGFLRNYERGAAPPLTGAADAQANAIARVAVLVSGWAGSGGGAGADVCEDLDHGLPAAVRRATRVTQNSEAAVAWALAGAGIMERLVTGALLRVCTARDPVDCQRCQTCAFHADALYCCCAVAVLFARKQDSGVLSCSPLSWTWVHGKVQMVQRLGSRVLTCRRRYVFGLPCCRPAAAFRGGGVSGSGGGGNRQQVGYTTT